jgi:Flp pilus assembly protein TadB
VTSALLASALAGIAVLIGWRPDRAGRSRRRAVLGTRVSRPIGAPSPASARIGRPLAVASVFLAVTSLLGGMAGVVGGALTAVVTSRVLARLPTRAELRRRARLAIDLPVCAHLVARALQAGAAPVEALELAAASLGPPVSSVIDPAVAQLRLGADPAHICADLQSQDGFAPFARALVRSLTSGTALADALDRLSDDLRGARRHALDRRARTVGVRAAAPLGLCFLPAFLLLGVVPVVVGLIQQVLVGLP